MSTKLMLFAITSRCFCPCARSRSVSKCVCDVVHRAEVERALDPQDLRLRAFVQVAFHRGELPRRMARVGHEAAHRRVGGAVEVEDERDRARRRARRTRSAAAASRGTSSPSRRRRRGSCAAPRGCDRSRRGPRRRGRASRRSPRAGGRRQAARGRARSRRARRPRTPPRAASARPASKLGPERFTEALVGKPEKKLAATLPSPWPMNSWLASIRWPDLSAIARAIEIACESETSVSAIAEPARCAKVSISNRGCESGGSSRGSGPIVWRPVSPGPSQRLEQEGGDAAREDRHDQVRDPRQPAARRRPRRRA